MIITKVIKEESNYLCLSNSLSLFLSLLSEWKTTVSLVKMSFESENNLHFARKLILTVFYCYCKILFLQNFFMYLFTHIHTQYVCTLCAYSTYICMYIFIFSKIKYICAYYVCKYICAYTYVNTYICIYHISNSKL